MFNHVCIKPACDNSYEDSDQDAYYCPTCQEANKKLAQQIDAQVASRPKRSRTSDLELAKREGKVTVERDGTEVISIRV